MPSRMVVPQLVDVLHFLANERLLGTFMLSCWNSKGLYFGWYLITFGDSQNDLEGSVERFGRRADIATLLSRCGGVSSHEGRQRLSDSSTIATTAIK